METTTETDLKSFKSNLGKQDAHSHPVYSWLCNNDYNQYSSKIFKENDDK